MVLENFSPGFVPRKTRKTNLSLLPLPVLGPDGNGVRSNETISSDFSTVQRPPEDKTRHRTRRTVVQDRTAATFQRKLMIGPAANFKEADL